MAAMIGEKPSKILPLSSDKQAAPETTVADIDRIRQLYKNTLPA